MKLPLKLPILAALMLVFALYMVFGRDDPPVKEPYQTPPSSVYENTVGGIGVIEPKSETIAIATELSGVVRRLYVKENDFVDNNAPLFSLDTRDIEAQIKLLEASLAAAKVQAKDAAVQFSLVENVTDVRAVAREDYNRRLYAKALAEARVKEAQARLEEAKITLARLTVRAPLAGTILDVNIRPGEFAQAGLLTEPLIRMGDLSTLHIRVEVDEENTAAISSQSKAMAYPRGNPNLGYSLSFVRFEPFVRPKQNLAVQGQRVDTRVLQIIYALEQKNDLFVGQQMDVFIDRKAHETP